MVEYFLLVLSTRLILQKLVKNLLPRRVFKRVAPTFKFSKIKLGFPKKVVWLTIISFIFLNLSGYYPVFDFPPVKKSQVLAQGLEQTGEVIPASFSKPLNLPHPGYLSTRFSTWHPGIDIASGLGMPIHPIIDGVVEKVGHDIFGLGNYVTVSHEKDLKSTYAHMGRIFARVGDKISSENTIGEVGLTGHTSGPHTHLEISLNDKFVDPQKLLPELPNMPMPNTLVKK